MCIIHFNLNNHNKYKLVIATNRDESLKRPTKKAHWHDAVLSGIDLVKLGTWLGINKSGKIAMITNVRNKKEMTLNFEKSRGNIVSNFLKDDIHALDYLKLLQKESHKYGGFNVILGTVEALYYMNNYDNCIQLVSDGIHGLSNETLDTPWQKVTEGNAVLKALNDNDEDNIKTLFKLLESKEKTWQHNQHTGLPEDLEYQLSSQFIEIPDKHYGTHCSTVILVTHNNEVTFIERTHNNQKEHVKYKFKIKE